VPHEHFLTPYGGIYGGTVGHPWGHSNKAAPGWQWTKVGQNA